MLSSKKNSINWVKNTFAIFFGLDFSKYFAFLFLPKFSHFLIGPSPQNYVWLALIWPIVGLPAIYGVYKGKKWCAYVLLAFLPLSLLLYHTCFQLPIYSKIGFYLGSILFLYLIYIQWKKLK